MRIQDKVVVVTGGAAGLGLGTARYLLREKGARIAIFDLDAKAAAEAVADLGADRAMFVETDVSDETSVQNAVDAVMNRFGAIHVCINGVASPTGFNLLGEDGKAAPLARFARVTAVNLNGVFNVMSKCAQQMARNAPDGGQERGVVINVSSGTDRECQVGHCADAAAKAAIIGMNMPAALELGSIGVRVNAIAPGLFLTANVSALDPRTMAALTAQMEAPKRLGDVREFAHCCAFIVESAYLNAATIRLDAASRLRAH